MIRKLVMFFFAIVIFYSMMLAMLNQTNSDNLFENSETVLQGMKQSLQFVQQKQRDNNSSIAYSVEMKSFYEWTNWKRIKESKYANHRDGDNGIIRSFSLNTYYIDNELGFNSPLNDHIPLDRALSDFRPNLCKHWHYLPQALPSVSVIIFFFNEDLTILLRSIYSILMNTPRNLLVEIILMVDNPYDDIFKTRFLETIKNSIKNSYSQVDAFLLDKFSNYSHQMPMLFGEKFDLSKIRLLVTDKRSGLGNSLNIAIRKATGKVLVFLKSHVEVSHNWLPPLLAPIIDDWNTVSIPNFIDVKPNSFKYNTFKNGNFDLTFWNWGLFTKSATSSLSSSIDHYEYLQTLPYGLGLLPSSQFAISKDFFHKIGLFDKSYLILSEINLDLSLKILHCRGRIVKIPCSNVFILRKTIPNRMMELFDEVIIENDFHFEPICYLKTMAQKWIPPSNISNFYAFHPSLYGDLCQNASNNYDMNVASMATEHCSNPNNILSNLATSKSEYSIVYENILPVIQVKSFWNESSAKNLLWGGIKNSHYSICLNVETSRLHDTLKLESAYCYNKTTLTVFRLDVLGVLRIEDYCLYPTVEKVNETFEMKAVNCFFGQWKNMSKWQYTKDGQFRLYYNFCLTFADSLGILLAPCSKHLDSSQLWQWTTY